MIRITPGFFCTACSIYSKFDSVKYPLAVRSEMKHLEHQKNRLSPTNALSIWTDEQIKTYLLKAKVLFSVRKNVYRD